MEERQIQNIEGFIKDFLDKIGASLLSLEVKTDGIQPVPAKEVLHVDIKVQDPQMFIGHNGQTLWEIERLLKIVFHKKLKQDLYVSLDINEYKIKKIEHLQAMAQSLAEEVLATRESKALPPMPAYDRRIIHAQLSGRGDVATESQGVGEARRLVIKPK